jgi:hypothetical protein
MFVWSQAQQEVPDWLENIAEGAIGTDYGPAGGRFGSRDTRRQVCKDYGFKVQNCSDKLLDVL